MKKILILALLLLAACGKDVSRPAKIEIGGGGTSVTLTADPRCPVTGDHVVNSFGTCFCMPSTETCHENPR